MAVLSILYPSSQLGFPVGGGDEEDRTPDPLLAKQVLSQLSYTPVFVGFRLPLVSFLSS